jgi:hypothetical protein
MQCSRWHATGKCNRAVKESVGKIINDYTVACGGGASRTGLCTGYGNVNWNGAFHSSSLLKD